MQFIESNRQRQKFVHEANSYSFDKYSSDGTKMFWRCDKRDSDGCKARIHTNRHNNQVIKTINQHTHGSDITSIEITKIKTSIKLRAINTVEIPSQIINHISQVIPNSIRGAMPNRDAIRKLIQRKRIDIHAPTINITNLSSIQIPPSLQFYTSTPEAQERFLLIDSGQDDPNRFLVFGKASNIQWAHQMSKVYMDGTFKTTPAPFSQIYVILSERCGFVFPILYALLPNKKQSTYTSLFNKVKELWPTFNPSTITIDFETGVINSIRAVFPNSSIYGCFFHLIKNLKKKISEEGLMSRYNSDPEFSLQARMIGALAFIPPDSLNEAFQVLQDNINEELHVILHYFEDSYMGRLNIHGQRSRPLYPNEIWSVYSRTLAGNDRTNNHAEAAHRRMNAEFSLDHPTIFKFLKIIKKIQSGRDLAYENFVRGDHPPTKRNKYLIADARIRNIVESYGRRTIIEFLRGISHNYLMD